jgi:O-antigen/teichoic acid export membrane protein
VVGIVIFVVTIVFLFSFGDNMAAAGGAFARWYHYHYGIGFILFANVLQAAVTLLLLFKGWKEYKPRIDTALLKKVLLYGFPILIAGFAGQINDTLNRVMFMELSPATDTENVKAIGSFTMALRLAVLINLVIQAFKMAAEPFFFSIAQDKDARPTYARVMKWFVIVMALMFLNVTLYMDIWRLFIGEHTQAIHLVPVMLLSYIFLGIYYNLTVWYKLTDRTYFGTYIMVIGSVVTIVFNWLLIPVWGYNACAWGTLLCYAVMMLLSFMWGQKYYPIPYEVPKMGRYLGVMLLLYAIQAGISKVVDVPLLRIATGTVLFGAYLFYILKQEKQELRKFPVIGKLIK